MLRHETPPGHAERPGRLQAVLDALEGMPLRSPRSAVRRARSDRARASCALRRRARAAFAETRDARVRLDADTYLSDGSREAVYRAAGACVAAVDAVMNGEDDMAFCAVRPPGHHAEPSTPMGFCIFNNVAIGALHALEAHGLERSRRGRFRRPSRQRHANRRGARAAALLRLHAPIAALSRHRRRRRNRHRRQRRQRAAAAGRGRAPMARGHGAATCSPRSTPSRPN